MSAPTKKRRVNVEISDETYDLMIRFSLGHPGMRHWLLRRMIDWATQHVDDVVDEFHAAATARVKARRKAERRKCLQVVR